MVRLEWCPGCRLQHLNESRRRYISVKHRVQIFLFTLWKRMGSEGRVPHILEFGTREKSIFSSFGLFTSGVYATVPTQAEAGWAPKLLWTS